MKLKCPRNQSNNWIITPRRNPDAKMRLFCFPYAGTGASAFNEWRKGLSEGIELCLLQPPGRENRENEKPLCSITEMLNELTLAISPRTDKPFAFYGHSGGAVLAYLVAVRLSEEATTPMHLFVGESPAPHVPNPLLENLYKKEFNTWQDEEIIAVLRKLEVPEAVLANPEYMEIILPLVKTDLFLGAQLEVPTKRQIGCPITVFVGQKAKAYPRPILEAWREYTNASFELVGIDGGHLFVNQSECSSDAMNVIQQKIVQ